MFETILGVLSAAFTLWDDLEKDKYVSKLVTLKEQYYAEFNKPADQRSDAVLDNIEFELRLLATGFASSVGTKNTQDKSGPSGV